MHASSSRFLEVELLGQKISTCVVLLNDIKFFFRTIVQIAFLPAEPSLTEYTAIFILKLANQIGKKMVSQSFNLYLSSYVCFNIFSNVKCHFTLFYELSVPIVFLFLSSFSQKIFAPQVLRILLI